MMDRTPPPEHTIALSVVIPLYNEEASIGLLLERLAAVLAGVDTPYEIIVVDDGSTDGTWRKVCALHKTTRGLRALRLSRNFGHQGALLAGLSAARGDAVVTMDGDLQHPPEVIPSLLAAWRSGYRIVNTCRQDREVAGWFKRFTSRVYYRLFSLLSDIRLNEGSSDFRLLDRRAVDALLDIGQGDLFLRGAVQTLGFRTAMVPFKAGTRHAGRSKFTLRKMLFLARSGVIAHSTRPLTIGIWLGLVTACLAVAELVYVLIQSAHGLTVPGWASVMGVTTLLFAVVFVMLGLMGAYVASLHRMIHRRPNFIVDDQL